MALVVTDDKHYQNIAHEIREKTDSDKLYPPASMAAGVNDVYEAGKASMIDQSKIIEKTVSGKMISVDDVSEIPHEVAIQLSSDTVTDFSGVTVKVLGENLATAQQVWKGAGEYSEMVFEGRNVVKFKSHSTFRNQLPIFKENTQYIFSFDAKVWSTGGDTNNELILKAFYSDGTYSHIVVSGNVDWTHYTLITSAGKTITAIGHDSYHYTHNIYVDIDTFQLKKATATSDYEPYNEKVYTPNANGTVEGITSTSPNMTVFTDNADVEITMDYHQSYGAWLEWNRFWDIYQQAGTRENYWGAFTRGWFDALFKPKYPIKPTDCGYMFMYTGITDINVDIDLRGANAASNIMAYTYGVVQRVKKIILKNDGSQTFIDSFVVASGLIDIAFEGVIGQSISFQWSTGLSKESIINIFEHFSTTATFTATFSKTAVTNAFGSTTATEWTNLVASRPNVTISLVKGV